MEDKTIKKIFGGKLLGAVIADGGGTMDTQKETMQNWIDYLWHDWDAWTDFDHNRLPQFVRDVEGIVWKAIEGLRGQEVTKEIVSKLMRAACMERFFTLEELNIYWGGNIPSVVLEKYYGEK